MNSACEYFLRVFAVGLCMSIGFFSSSMQPDVKKAKKIGDQITEGFLCFMCSDGQEISVPLSLLRFSKASLDQSILSGSSEPIQLDFDAETFEQVEPILDRLARLDPEVVSSLVHYEVTNEDLSHRVLAIQHALGIPIIVELQSSDGKSLMVPFQVACHSEMIRTLLFDAGNAQAIELGFDYATLSLLVDLFYELHRLMEQKKDDPFLYIPRSFQPFVNTQIKKGLVLENESIPGTITSLPPALPVPMHMNKTLVRTIELLQAAHYLDNYYVLNAVVAYFVDQIPPVQWEAALNTLKGIDVQGGSANVDCLQGIPRDLMPFVLKHLTHRMCGITQECSVADIIREEGQPQFIRECYVKEVDEELENYLDMQRKKITSLFGLSLIQVPREAEALLLEGNCLGDISCDGELNASPFKELSSLKRLLLNNNYLTNLPGDFFYGLENLRWLSLDENQLTSVPAGLLRGLGSLEEFHASSNRLQALPAGFFDGCRKIYSIGLPRNSLKALPQGLFNATPKLGYLFVWENDLESLPEGLLIGLPIEDFEAADNPCAEEELREMVFKQAL